MLRPLERVRVLPRSHVASQSVHPLAPLPGSRARRILDLDSECRPDAYLGSDFTTRALTGIAAQFIDEPVMWCRCITSRRSWRRQSIQMLTEFHTLYDQADIVTGHNIRRHDLPIISGASIYFGLPPLSSKWTSDTLLDGPKSGLVFSRSQENLGELFEILSDKYHMNNHRWKRANTLEAVELTRTRVQSDVEMHVQLRDAMISRNLLGPPKVWRAGGLERAATAHQSVRRERTNG